MHPPDASDPVLLLTIGVRHFLSPVAQQLGILTKDSLGNSWIKIITHVLPRYEEAVTLINKGRIAWPAESLL